MDNIYVAILTPTRKNVNTITPKRLLLHIYDFFKGEFFRDHLWIKESSKLDKIVYYRDSTKKIVTFTAFFDP